MEEISESLEVARKWCASKGNGWSVGTTLGAGGTAPVFEVVSPDGPRALKIYDAKFSNGEKGEIEAKRIEQQLALSGHDCPFLVQVYDGGRFEGRLVLLMSRAPGKELEKQLKAVPRDKIRSIVDQVARAAIFLREKGLCHRDIKAANVFVSDDFDHCTLLDISVIRDITDPIGIGTDYEGQLPVVATARYSPPEYLFRLLEPSVDLWHALNVYQLGALLHDLIMRTPLFQSEYEKSASNRYRFAWIVATTTPSVFAEDVDKDLILTAQRSLEKDWQRRRSLALEDFLADSNIQQNHALQVLGLGVGPISGAQDQNLTARIQRVTEVCTALDDTIVSYLRAQRVTPKHESRPGPDDTSKLISFKWTARTAGQDSVGSPIELRVMLALTSRPTGPHLGLSLEILATLDGNQKSEKVKLPEFPDRAGIDSILSQQAIAAFESMAIKITRTME